MRRLVVVAAVLSIFAAAFPASAAGSDKQSYIVVLKDRAAPAAVAAEHAARHGAEVSARWSHALKGYAARMSAQAAARIADDARVAYVEPDGVAYKSATQLNAVWGLDRIDQRDLPLSTTYTYDTTGTGVTAYVIDSGISSHPDFAGRLLQGKDYVDDDTNAADCDGHGTHVAGTIGGTTYGVAKTVALVPVRVLDCSGSGSWSDVISGINWVTANAAKPAVANMSLGGGAAQSVDDAVTNSIAAGITYAVAAGNSNRDACSYSPARTPNALTVGATSSTDARASFSNYGTCLDVFAPGVGITSTVMSGGTESWNGTSMASPHVAGAAARFLEKNPGASPATVESSLEAAATTGKVTSAGTGSPNLLLYGTSTVTEPPPAQPMSVAISQSLVGKGQRDLQVTVTVTSAGAPVAGASVTGVLRNNTSGSSWNLSGTTSTSGTVSWKLGRAPNGCYVTTIDSVTSPNKTWTGPQSSTPLCKGV